MRIPADRVAFYLALLLAGLLTSISIARGGFVAGYTDSSGYVSAGDLWRRGNLYRPEPLHFWAAWPNATETASPVAYRAGVVRGTEVPVYPMGFPLLIAAAVWLGGPLASYLVAPVMGAVLVLCTFALARDVAGGAAGLMAAGLMASSPVMLYHTVHPMSDVPAAAWWTVAWWLGLRGGASAGLAAGLAASMAILTRPNLAPLAVVVAAVVLLGGASRLASPREWRWRASATFVAAAALGPVVVAWSQAVLYGDPLVPGYVGWEGFFRAAHIVPNLRMYPRLLSRTHTLLPLTGLALVLLALLHRSRGMYASNVEEPFRRNGPEVVVAGPESRHQISPRRPIRALSRTSRVVTLSAGAIVLLNVALLLPYLSFDDWPSLRFLLPGLAALFVLFAGLLAQLTWFVWARVRWPAVVVPLAAVFVAAQGIPHARYALEDWHAQARIRLMGHYLREVLPPNAAVLSFVHGGAVAHYTGREVVRLDVLDPRTLDRVVDDLTRYNYRPVFVLDQALEEGPFLQLFAASRFGRLDWAPRAVFTTVTSIVYFDAADRERHHRGERWPIDTLR